MLKTTHKGPTDMIKIGDRVSFKWDYDGNTYLGTLMKEEGSYNSVLFDNPDPCWHQGTSGVLLSKVLYRLVFAEPQLTTQERVVNKCQLLWNKSNWVKSHPNLQY